MYHGDFEIWLNHFEYHARRARCIAPGFSDLLMADERRLIASSIANVQRGKQSEGHALLQAAQRFARVRRVPALVRIVELLICEQQRHAALLRVFMEQHQVPLKKTRWSGRVFGRFGRLAGLELRFYLLISAGLIRIVYFRALEAATNCQRLVRLCRSLVSDELAHVGFESQLLLALRADRPAPVQTLIRSGHRALVATAVGILWFKHRPVLRRAGYGMRSFLHDCLSQYAFYLEPINVARIHVGSLSLIIVRRPLCR